MKNMRMSIVAVVVMICNAATVGDLRAQKPSAMPMEHRDVGGHPGDRMGGPSDGAFHRSFEDADKWAKEFDNPERDAWQKPEEILEALNLQRTSVVADIGAGTGYFSVNSPSAFQRVKYSPPISSQTWCVTSASVRCASI